MMHKFFLFRSSLLIAALSVTPLATATTITDQKTTGNCSPVINETTGNVTVVCNNGITLEQYEAGLKRREAEVRAELQNASPEKLKLLQIEKNAITEKLANIEQSFVEQQKLFAETKALLEKLKKTHPAEQLESAQNALEAGNAELAKQLLDKVIENGKSFVAQAAFQRGELARNDIEYRAAMKNYKLAVMLEPENPQYLNEAGRMAKTLGDYDQAQIWLEKYRETREQNDPDTVNHATALNNLALLYKKQSKYDTAEPLYKRAIEIGEKTLGTDHPDVATRYNNLAGLYESQGKYDTAEPLYKRAIEIGEKTLGTDHPDVATRYNNLAELYRAQGKYDAAEPLYKRALKIWESRLGENHPNIASVLNNLASLYESQGKYDAAEPLYKRALEIDEKILGKNHPDTATDYNNLATLSYHQKRYEQSAEYFQRAIAILEQVFPDGHPNLDVMRENYAILKAQMAK